MAMTMAVLVAVGLNFPWRRCGSSYCMDVGPWEEGQGQSKAKLGPQLAEHFKYDTGEWACRQHPQQVPEVGKHGHCR